MLAHIYADIPSPRLDRYFSYQVPLEMEDNLKSGCRVLVSFGNREVEGFVRAVEPGSGENLKPILQLLDREGPVLTEELLAMGEWMAHRYVCSVAQALKIMVPAALKKKQQEIIRWNGDDLDLVVLSESYPNLGAFIERLAADKYMPISQARRVLGSRLLQELIEGELLVKEGAYRHQVRSNRCFMALPLTEARLQQLRRRSPRQAEFYEWLMAAGIKAESDIRRSFVGIKLDTLLNKGIIQEVLPAGSLDQPPQLTPEQQAVFDQLRVAAGEVLLHGVTGSGKTEIYLRLIEERLNQGDSCLVLVPEIGLTEHLVTTFMGRLGDKLAVWHSRMSAGERMVSWQRIQSGEAQVVLGPRSAIFAPVSRLGLIIVDEEQEPSYKQEETPRYHVLEAARWRTNYHGGLLVSGSATPSLETYHRAQSGEIKLVSLEQRIAGRPMPQVEVVDMRQELKNGNRSMFSIRLQSEIGAAIGKQEQAIIFINRRGFASFVLCRACGYRVECGNCSVAMTYHQSAHQMICHYCGQTTVYPTVCPECGSKYIRQFGTGTERVEDELRKLFPGARVMRMDLDTTRGKHGHRMIIEAMKKREIDILVGTQMVAKGFDFPAVSLVGVLAADSLFNLPDFRAPERAYQLLSQVAGRAGRSDIPGQVIIQTYEPDHQVLNHIINHDYIGFYRDEIMERARLGYPPFTRLLKVVAWSGEREQAKNAIYNAAHRLEEFFNQWPDEQAMVLGPAPCPLFRLRGQYRYGIMVKSTNGGLLQAAGQYIIEGRRNEARLEIDIDPITTY